MEILAKDEINYEDVERMISISFRDPDVIQHLWSSVPPAIVAGAGVQDGCLPQARDNINDQDSVDASANKGAKNCIGVTWTRDTTLPETHADTEYPSLPCRVDGRDL